MANFTDILNKPSSEIKKPPPIPAGSYIAVIDGPAEITQVGAAMTDTVKVKYRLMQAMADVDQSNFAEFNPLGRNITQLHWENSIHTLRKVCDDAKIDDAGGTKSLGERLPELPGKQIIVVVKHSPSKDGTSINANVTDTAAA